MTERPERAVVLVGLSPGDALRVVQPGRRVPEWFRTVDALVIQQDSGAGADVAGADPSVLAAAITARVPEARLVIEASFARDFPYNLARRVASVAALSGLGSGVLLRAAESVLPRDEAASPGELADDGAVALRKLWQSWPLDSVIADRARRRFVDASGIRRAAHAGAFSVAGPLQIPVDQDEQPVVLRRFRADDVPSAASADALVTAADAVEAAAATGLPVLIETDGPGLAAALRTGGDEVIGVYVNDERVVGGELGAELASFGTVTSGSLRSRLGLSAPAECISAESSAFTVIRERW